MTSFQSKKRLNSIFCFFILLIACSCNESKETPIKVDLVPWEKAKGKIIVFDYYYALITNSETRQIDTLLKTPAGLQIGEYCIYGTYGVSYAAKRNLLIFTTKTSLIQSQVQTINLDGSNQQSFTIQKAPRVSYPIENSTGSIAYFVSDDNSSPQISSLWIDQKKLFTFSTHQVDVMNYLDWHPSNEAVLVGLMDKTQAVPFPSLTEIDVRDSTLHTILPAKESTDYYHPRYSPDGNEIAFIEASNTITRLCVINRDGTHLRILTDECSLDSYLAWSPDGSKIAYTLRDKGVYVMNADGTNNMLVFKFIPGKWVGNEIIWIR
jgi:Tol biopolymer transport system component